MIPKDFITEWRQFAPWLLDAQIEQDLIISRVLAEMFAHPLIQPAFAFRGGTALYKLHLLPPARYSEDIDLVQITPEPIGTLVSVIRTLLDSWLGDPNRAFKENGVTLTYRFVSETLPPIPLKLKIEINSREHLAVFGFLPKTLTIKSRWFTGQATLLTYCLEELLATKLRALYQRRKGRDLFDLWLGLTQGQADPQQILTAFHLYLQAGGHHISSTAFTANLHNKLLDPNFTQDIKPLLAHNSPYAYDVAQAAQLVIDLLISHL